MAGATTVAVMAATVVSRPREGKTPIVLMIIRLRTGRDRFEVPVVFI